MALLKPAEPRTKSFFLQGSKSTRRQFLFFFRLGSRVKRKPRAFFGSSLNVCQVGGLNTTE